MLQDELKKINEQFRSNAPLELVEKIESSIAKLAGSKLVMSSLKVGDKMPSFALFNATSKIIKSEDLLSNGPLVINFYRGGWWPFCNLELGGYQEIIDEIHRKGAQLVAITPELPNETLSTAEKLNLEYEILSDTNNEIGKKFGIVFSMEDELKDVYKGFGVDLVTTQGNDNFELPAPGTFVVDKNGFVLLAHVDVNHTSRMEPEEVLLVL